MFLGINKFLALLRAHFNPRYARAKMILSRAKNLFMPANVTSIVIKPNLPYNSTRASFFPLRAFLGT